MPLPGHLMPRWGLWRRGGCHALLGPRALPAPLPALHTVSPCGFEGWDRELQTVKLLKQRDTGFPGSLVQSVTGSRIGMHVTGRWAECDPWEGSRTQSHPAHTGLCPGMPGSPCVSVLRPQEEVWRPQPLPHSCSVTLGSSCQFARLLPAQGGFLQ